RVDIAVARMKDVGDPDLIASADLLDHAQDLRQLGPGHNAVLRAEAGGEPANRAERLLATLPEEQPFRVRIGLTDRAGMILFGDGDDVLGIRIEARFQAV